MKFSDIQHLLALDALGETTPEQRAELGRLLEKQPALKADRDGIKAAFRHLDQAGQSPLPPSVRERLVEARRRDFTVVASTGPQRGEFGNIIAYADRTGVGTAFQQVAKGAQRRRKLMTLLAQAAIVVLLAAPLAWWLLQTKTGGEAIATAGPALAPRGETGMTQPMLVWDNLPGQTYNVWILGGGAKQDADAVFQAENVTSPLPFAKLKPGKGNPEKATELRPGTPYAALVCLADGGRFAGEMVPFWTAPAALGAPPAPSEISTVSPLVQLLLDNGRPSDALMVIAGLPEHLQRSEKLKAIESRVRQSLKSK